MRKWIALGLGHIGRAVAIDADNPDALEVRGNLQYWSWLNGLEPDAVKAKALLNAARADLEKATTLNRNQAGAFASLSHLYYQTGVETDVIIAAQRALEADEFLSNADVIHWRLFISNYDLGHFDKADQWCQEIGRRFAASVNAVRCRLYLLTANSAPPDVPAAWRLADSLVAITPPSARPYQRLNADILVAAVIARASKSQPALVDSARHVAKRSESSAAVDPTRDLSYSGAFVYALLRDTDNALRLLKDYLAANPQRVESFRGDHGGWWFDELARNPGFVRLTGSR
jgi:serine/threonine-protein kinase